METTSRNSSFTHFHISPNMKRRRLVEPCCADAAGDERGASSTSPSVPEAPWEAAPDEGNVYIDVVAGGTDARVAHRVMQIRVALACEVKDRHIVFRDGWAASVVAFDVVALSPLDEVFKGQKLWCVASGELYVEYSRTMILTLMWGQWVRYTRADQEIMVGEIKRRASPLGVPPSPTC